ncbi:MAG: universal stress protein [Helicobacteraceae bacterium]|jgi:nucleotide-binding universal stress UspA family protein|nr:universal stress protein [Helicobacteraceae bacterium]
MEKRIIAAVDFSEQSAVACKKAASVGKKIGAGLTVVHAVNASFLGRFLNGTAEREAAISQAQERLVGELKDSGITADTVVEIADAGEMIARIAKNAALIVLGDHSGFTVLDLLTGTTARRVIEHTKTPLLVVKTPRPYEKAVIATDFSEDSKAAASAALNLFDQTRFIFFSAFLVPSGTSLGSYGIDAGCATETLQKEHNEADEKLRAFTEELGVKNAERIVHASASPNEEILAICEKKEADLLVMGTRGIGSLLPMMVGSTAESLLRRCKIDLLLLKL